MFSFLLCAFSSRLRGLEGSFYITQIFTSIRLVLAGDVENSTPIKMAASLKRGSASDIVRELSSTTSRGLEFEGRRGGDM